MVTGGLHQARGGVLHVGEHRTKMWYPRFNLEKETGHRLLKMLECVVHTSKNNGCPRLTLGEKSKKISNTGSKRQETGVKSLMEPIGVWGGGLSSKNEVGE